MYNWLYRVYICWIIDAAALQEDPSTPSKPLQFTPLSIIRGGQSTLPYLAIIKCFGTMWGIYKRWSNLFSLPHRSKWKYCLFFCQTELKHLRASPWGSCGLLRGFWRCNRWRPRENNWSKFNIFFYIFTANIFTIKLITTWQFCSYPSTRPYDVCFFNGKMDA